MIRKGECNGCGHCCTAITRVKLYFPTGDKAFKKARGIAPNGTKWIDVIDPCQHHIDDRCAIHDNKPQTCIDFPLTAEDIRDTPCSYWFEDEEGNVLT